jgi:hypothetical protein
MSISTWNLLLRNLQFAGYAIVFASLPLSNYFMSFGMFWLAGAWILQVATDVSQRKPFALRWQNFRSQRPVWIISAIFLLALIGLFWSEDMKHAQWDLRMKLPLLVMPFLLGTLSPISNSEYRRLLGVFLLSLTIAVIWCLLIYWHINPKPYNDVREISVFISHIRFSLLLITGIFILALEAWDKPYGKSLTVLLSGLFLLFLFVIGSMTGFAVLIITTAYLVLTRFRTTVTSRKGIALIALIGAILLSGIFYIAHEWRSYFNVGPLNAMKLEQTTPRGEVYEHNLNYPMVEDGRYIMTHIAWGELYQAWSKRSAVNPDSTDASGHVLKGTLIRYLASKGLYKDADGIAALSDDDVRAIEAGMTTAHEHSRTGISKRLNRIFFEYANYKAGGTPNGHSVFQRLEFWRAALHIIEENPWAGVGTGDTKIAFASAYEKMNSSLDPQFQLRAHNQYLTMWLTYGIAGLLLFLSVLLAGWKKPGNRRPLLRVFIIICAMSFLSEDTLESQAGVMFFVMFLLLFSLKRELTLSELRPV